MLDIGRSVRSLTLFWSVAPGRILYRVLSKGALSIKDVRLLRTGLYGEQAKLLWRVAISCFLDNNDNVDVAGPVLGAARH